MKLYPPYIEGKLPAFVKGDSTNITIPFELNPLVGQDEIATMKLVLKTLTSTQIGDILSTTNIIFGEGSEQSKATFEIPSSFNLSIGQFYKVQLAFATPTSVGYYSSTGIIKCIGEPTLVINSLTADKITANPTYFTYTYNYAPTIQGSTTVIDTEKIYSYQFNIYDKYKQLYDTSGEQVHNANLNLDSDTWTFNKSLKPDTIYYLQCTVKTHNLYTISTPLYPIIDGVYDKLDSYYDNIELSVEFDQDNGYNKIRVNSIGAINGKYKIVRASNEDDYQVWNDIFEFFISNTSIGLVNKGHPLLWKDFFIKHGVEYKYAIQRYNDNGVRANRSLITKGILADFNDMFLFDGKRQLRIAFNPKVSSFKTTTLESKIETLGGRYPLFYRNGNVAYKDFSISGLISIHMDSNFEFFEEKKLNYILNLNDGVGAPKHPGSLLTTDSNYSLSTSLTTDMTKLELEFKTEVLDWLNNGEPKLFRSPTEGNFLVRLMNVSLSPNETLGRVLHTFNANAYEVADSDLFSLMKNPKFKPEAKQLNIISKEKQVLINATTNLPAANYQAIEVFGASNPSLLDQDDNPALPPTLAFGYYIWKDLDPTKTYKIVIDDKEKGRSFYNTVEKQDFDKIGTKNDIFETLPLAVLGYKTSNNPNSNLGYLIQSIGISGLTSGQFVALTLNGKEKKYLTNGFTFIEEKIDDCYFEYPENAKFTFYYYAIENRSWDQINDSDNTSKEEQDE